MDACRLLITGASGSGTTTLGRVVADRWSVPHADADDYFWLPTSPPYTDPRPRAERLALMRALFVPRASWVLSGSVIGWGDALRDDLDAVVLLTLAPGVRMRRLGAREADRHGGEVPTEGAAGEAHRAFMAWAEGYDDPRHPGRSRAQHERWLAGSDVPVLRLGSAAPVGDLAAAVLAGSASARRLRAQDAAPATRNGPDGVTGAAS